MYLGPNGGHKVREQGRQNDEWLSGLRTSCTNRRHLQTTISDHLSPKEILFGQSVLGRVHAISDVQSATCSPNDHLGAHTYP